MAEFASAIVALVATAQATVTATNRVLRTIKNANRDFYSYAEEVSHFHGTLQILRDQHSKLSHELGGPQSQLHRQFLSLCDRANNALMRVDHLNQKILGSQEVTPTNGPRIKKHLWLRNHSQVKEAVDELRNLRLMLLTTCELHSTSLLNVLITEVARSSAKKLSQTSGPTSVILQAENCGISTTMPLSFTVKQRHSLMVADDLACRCCPRYGFTIMRPFSGVEPLSGRLLIMIQPKPACNRYLCYKKRPYTIRISWSLPSWLPRQLDVFSVSAYCYFPKLTITMGLNGPKVVPWESPVLKAVRAKDVRLIRRLISTGAGSLYDVDECGSDFMESTLYRPGNFLDTSNLRTLVELLQFGANVGHRADNASGDGASTTIEIFIMLVLVQRATSRTGEFFSKPRTSPPLVRRQWT